jgi:hypothetical protein
MFHDVERTFLRVFCFLGIQKHDLDEVAEVFFYVGDWPCEHITCLLDFLKSDGEVDEEMFKVSNGNAKSFSASWESKKKGCKKMLK